MGYVWAIQPAIQAVDEEGEGVDTDEVVSATVDVVTILLGVGIGLAAGLLIALLVQLIARFLVRKNEFLSTTIHSISNSFEFSMGVAGAWIGMRIAWTVEPGQEESRWRALADHTLQIIFIIAVTWLAARVFSSIEAYILNSLKKSGDSRYLRKQTQLEILHRIILAAIWLLGIAIVLMTFSWGKALGSAIFTSAGLFSVVVGIAAQSTLGNVFAGLQLAFSDSIRMGDIVMWEENFTTVEEITLTYVVLKSWDGRRLIVPSKEMTGKTFENWTRRTPNLLGNVEFDVDWTVPIDGMRNELNRLLRQTDLWDGDTGLLQVSGTSAGRVQVTALLSGRNSAEVTDLKLYVREEMVKWLQKHVGAYEGAEEIAPEEPDDSQTLLDASGNAISHADAQDAQEDTIEPEGPTTADLTATQVINVADIPLLYPARVPVSERDGEEDEPTEESSPATDTNETDTNETDSTEKQTGHQSSMFTGSESAERRAEQFSGPGEQAYNEREEAYERRLASETGEMPVTDDDENPSASDQSADTDSASTPEESGASKLDAGPTGTTVMDPIHVEDGEEEKGKDSSSSKNN